MPWWMTAYDAATGAALWQKAAEHGRTRTVRRWTIAILITVTALLIAWDVYAVITGGSSGTISDVVLDFARAHPVVAFVLGVLCGHLLWPQVVRVKA